jgi:hypothetical protein
MKRIAVLGSGVVGQVLADGFLRHGLWCIPGFLQNRWTHAFKLLKA